MHIQARAAKGTPLMVDDDHDEGTGVTVSAHYDRGVLSELLGILAGQRFNLRAGSGHDIELGGEFSFWVDARKDDQGNPIDADEHEAIQEAARVLRDAEFTVTLVEVQARLLDDTQGTLKAFVDEVTDAGLLIKEISVGTPQPESQGSRPDLHGRGRLISRRFAVADARRAAGGRTLRQRCTSAASGPRGGPARHRSPMRLATSETPSLTGHRTRMRPAASRGAGSHVS